MKKLTTQQKQDALQNLLSYFQFSSKYFIQITDKRLGVKFAIASNSESGGVNIHTKFMTYEEMNCYLMGYNKAKTQPF